MKRILQRYATDCFPTCVAMVLGVSHNKALKIVHPKHKKGQDYRTYFSKGIKILRALGYKVRYRKHDDLKSIKNLSIIGIVRDTGGRHSVVYNPSNQKIYDPSPIVYSNRYYAERIRIVAEITHVPQYRSR